MSSDWQPGYEGLVSLQTTLVDGKYYSVVFSRFGEGKDEDQHSVLLFQRENETYEQFCTRANSIVEQLEEQAESMEDIDELTELEKELLGKSLHS